MSKKISFPNARVLVVDDNRVNLKVSKALLESFKCSVTTAMSGMETLELIEKKGEQFDVIFMDLLMPVMGGVETTCKLREVPGYQDSLVVALSGAQISTENPEFLSAKFSSFLLKPLAYEALSECLEAVIPEFIQIGEENSQNQIKRSKKLESLSSKAGLNAMWDDDKMYSDFLTLFLQKSMEYMNEISGSDMLCGKMDVIEALLLYGRMAGTLKLNKLLSEMLGMLKIGEEALAQNKFVAVDEEYKRAIDEINKYLSERTQSKLEDILTFC